MKRILFVLAAIAVLAAGGFALSPSAQADDAGAGTACAGSRRC